MTLAQAAAEQSDLAVVQPILQALTLIAVVVGLFFTIRQLRILGQTYVDFHDWNRRKAAQEALETVRNLSEDTPLLDEKFRIMSEPDPLPLALVTSKCEENGDVRIALHKRLNHFEMIAIGVDQKVLDAEVIRKAYALMFRKNLTIFKHYIEHRRNRGNADAWINFERLSNKWREEENQSQPREPTGQGRS